MKKLTMTLVVFFAVTALTASAFAAGPGWKRGHGGAPYGGACYYGGGVTAVPGMNLTAEQTAKINALREAHLKDAKPLQDKMFSKRGELRLLWLERNPDEKKITETRKDIRVLRDQMGEKRDSHRLNVLKVLTPEQQETLKSYRPGRGFGTGMRGGAEMQKSFGHHGDGPRRGMRGAW